MPVPQIVDWINNNNKQIECTFYDGIGGIAFTAALGSAWTAQWYATAGATAVWGAASYAAELSGCDKPARPAPDMGQCSQVENGTANLQYFNATAPAGSQWITLTDDEIPGQGEITKILSADLIINDLQVTTDVLCEKADGTTTRWLDVKSQPVNEEYLDNFAVRLDPIGEAYCFGPPPPEPGEPIGDPIPGPEIEGCTYTITPIEAYVDENGRWFTKFRVEGTGTDCDDPYEYWQGPGDPIFVNPDPDNPDPIPPPEYQPRQNCPDPCPDPCIDYTFQLNRMEDKIDEILRNQYGPGGVDAWEVFDRIFTILEVLMEVLGTDEQEAEMFPGVKYTLQGVCEPVEPGKDQPVKERTIPQTKGLYATIARIDAVMLFLQDHLDYRHRTCTNVKPTLEGSWVSTRWVSDGDSPDSNSPLRKLFRYRSKSTRTDDELREYWSQFTWQAGSVCVQHSGAWWGTPQVWAETEEEGRRVIRFAAGEAGIDPDQIGKWGTSSSSSPRYGMPGTMRLEIGMGVRWVTRRDGPSGI